MDHASLLPETPLSRTLPEPCVSPLPTSCTCFSCSRYSPYASPPAWRVSTGRISIRLSEQVDAHCGPAARAFRAAAEASLEALDLSTGDVQQFTDWRLDRGLFGQACQLARDVGSTRLEHQRRCVSCVQQVAVAAGAAAPRLKSITAATDRACGQKSAELVVGLRTHSKNLLDFGKAVDLAALFFVASRRRAGRFTWLAAGSGGGIHYAPACRGGAHHLFGDVATGY